MSSLNYWLSIFFVALAIVAGVLGISGVVLRPLGQLLRQFLHMLAEGWF